MSVEDLRIGLSKGPRGESAYECAVRHGYVGTEEQWLASLDGKSAYQIAVELGYVGTEAEWIASLKGAKGDKGRDADIWTIGEDDFWYVNGRKTIFKSRGEDGKSPLLRISTDGQSLEISSDGGQTWLPFEKNFNKLRVLGYVSSVQLLPRNANIGDIYGVWNPDVYSGRVDEEGHLIKGAYDLYVNTVRDWVEDYHITKVYDYDTELPSSATNGTTVLVPVDYLTLDKTKIDGYKVYRFSLDRNGWVLILDTAEIYASKDDIINYGDNVYALVQGDEEHTYELYRRDVGWVYFGTNASITYILVQDVNEGTETNILSGKAVADAYGRYIESPEFVRAYLDSEDKILWGIRTDGTVYFGAGVPPQVKEYIEEKIAELSLDEYEDIVAFLESSINGQPIFTSKKVSIIGDSISTFTGYIPSDYPSYYPHEGGERSSDVVSVEDTWWKKLINSTNSSLEVNVSYSGSTASNLVKGFSSRVPLLGTPDIIIVALGTNDSGRAVPIGNIDFDADTYDLSQFAPAYIKGIKDTISLYPYARIICLAFDMGSEYQNTIKTIAEHYNFDYIYVGDISDVHPNKIEMQAVSDKIYNTCTLSGLLFNKVDKERGKSLINEEYARGVHYIENPEFVGVKLDQDERILEATMADGTKLLPAGIKTPSIDLDGAVATHVDNPEFAEVHTDEDDRILYGVTKDGDFIDGKGNIQKAVEAGKLGIKVDSENGILTIGGKRYKLIAYED